MRKRILLIGTSHTYQYGADNSWSSMAPCTPEAEQAFRKMLADAAVKHGVSCIAEEMNKGSLTEAEKSASVPQLIAGILGLLHIFCEPNRQERVVLGIEQENDIRISALLNGKSEEDVEAALKEQFLRRESVWLQRVDALGTWPVLFICGANHVPSFSALLRQRRVECEVLDADWQA